VDITVSDILIDLVKTACVSIAFAYVLTRTKFFSEILDKKFTFKNQIILVLLFGALSVFGTYGGLKLPSGAIANVRDLGPIIAGLIGGPLVGVGAGLIGGIHRYFLGGFVCIPCGISAVIAGLLGGMIHKLMKGEFVKVWQAALLTIIMEFLHMGLVLLVARPYDQALATVKETIIPMIAANAIGVTIFALIIRNLIIERKTAAEKENYRRELQRTEYEMETARKMQQSILPDAPPQLEGFELAAFASPAWQVGGDFYDFIPLSMDRLGIVIADVSGKGMPAALFMALSRTSIRSSIDDTRTASEAMQRANTMILHDSRSGMFVTSFYAVLDPKTMVIQFVDAGHCLPLLFKQATGTVSRIHAEGIALGVVDDIDLEEKQIKLESNDMLIFYTDGITEAINENNEQFGEARLMDMIRQNHSLSPDNLIAKIKDEVLAFAHGQPQFDDITLIILKATKDNGGK